MAVAPNGLRFALTVWQGRTAEGEFNPRGPQMAAKKVTKKLKKAKKISSTKTLTQYQWIKDSF